MDDYTEMTIETYLAERLTKEITSYEKKSHFHRAWFIVKSLFWRLFRF